jgi:hypothetical protein
MHDRRAAPQAVRCLAGISHQGGARVSVQQKGGPEGPPDDGVADRRSSDCRSPDRR